MWPKRLLLCSVEFSAPLWPQPVNLQCDDANESQAADVDTVGFDAHVSVASPIISIANVSCCEFLT